uniref:Phosphatase tensin-type domain-containing protein n=1 Tax=Steinernema glaseri TaxID=37863 RepID=A0A1I7YLR0_9BILA
MSYRLRLPSVRELERFQGENGRSTKHVFICNGCLNGLVLHHELMRVSFVCAFSAYQATYNPFLSLWVKKPSMSAEAEQPAAEAVGESSSSTARNYSSADQLPQTLTSTGSRFPPPQSLSPPKQGAGLMETACSSVSTASSWVSEEQEISLSPTASTSGIVTLSSSEQLVVSTATHAKVTVDDAGGTLVEPPPSIIESDSVNTIKEEDSPSRTGYNVSEAGLGPSSARSGSSSPRPLKVLQLHTRKVDIEVMDDNLHHSSRRTIELSGRLGIVPYKWLDPFCKPLRSIVSQNRRRYIDEVNNLNLDLTYITDRIIAMGYPSHEAESLYRNTMLSTVYFLQLFHDEHFMVFNLRGEYIYDAGNFQYRVSAYEMTDHHPPRLELMGPFCEEMHTYLSADPENVVAVHCKAGKGRTGVMICAYLTYIRLYPTARQCMDYYSIVRTHNNKGVTIPSQRRYIYYFEHMLNYGLTYTPYQIELVGVYIEQPPQSGRFSNMNALSITVSCGDVEVFNSAPMVLSKETMEEENELSEKYHNYHGRDSFDYTRPDESGTVLSRRCFGWTIPTDQRVFLEGDVCVRIMRSTTADKLKKSSVKTKKLGHIWFNTMFTCHHYSNVPYVHGDEANPYPEDGTTIARKVSAEESEGATTNGEELPSSSKNMKKPKKNTHKYEICEPPGLEKHCPHETVSAIHRNSLEAPRASIRRMLEKAHEKNLVSDDYNERRRAALGSGEPIPKAPVGRPNANGPFCLVRNSDEHAYSYRTIEVDKVCKANNVPPGFKVIVVTRCINRCSAAEVDLGETCIQQIRHSQKFHEAKKRQEMQLKLENKIKKSIESAQKPRNGKLTDLFRKRKVPEKDLRTSIEETMKSYLFPHRPEARPPERYFRCPLACPPNDSIVVHEPDDDDDANRTITSGSSSYFRPAEDIFERLMAEEDESPGVEEDSE